MSLQTDEPKTTDETSRRAPGPREVSGLLGHLQFGRLSGAYFFALIFVRSLAIPESA